LKEDQFKVLKTMSEATSRMDLKMFAQKVNLSQNQTLEQIQELAKNGFLQKIGHGYGVAEKGKAALKAFTPVPNEKGFLFYSDIDKPLGLTALTMEEFYRLIKQVASGSLEFHLNRGDFEKWLSEVFNDMMIASEIERIRTTGLKGEDLRKELSNAIDSKYGIEELS
jgi:DNA-binding Lrp family transcriptional regulator